MRFINVLLTYLLTYLQIDTLSKHNDRLYKRRVGHRPTLPQRLESFMT